MHPLFCSEYIKDSVYFGGYPSEEWFKELIDFGITCFVDLTTQVEKENLKYNYNFRNTIHFPIRDNNAPLVVDNYIRLIINISGLIDKGEKIYIHCKGGHGRSGMVVASLMCYLENMLPREAIDVTTKIHSVRIQMKDKYRNRKCPESFKQRRFVSDLFRPIVVSKHDPHNVFDFFQRSRTRPIRSNNNGEMVNLLQDLRHRYNQSIGM